MEVLIVSSYNSGKINSFIVEQVNSLRKLGVECDFYKIIGKGPIGYLKNLKSFRMKVKSGNYDLIHAHYGLSGLLANLQRIVPVITTYHGSDVHFTINRKLSYLCSRLSEYNILTNVKQKEQLNLKDRFSVIPCGIDTNLFVPKDKEACRQKLGFKREEKIILFSSNFDREVKNPELAQKAISLLEDVRLIELKGYSREEVAIILNAVDAVLITSYYETGPLVAKEALACHTPVISTDVGDVKGLITDLNNCHITSYKPKDVAKKLSQALEKNSGCRGRSVIQDFELRNVAQSIKSVYSNVLKDKS